MTAQLGFDRVREIFPSAKEVLDFYHCNEYLHALSDAQYGKDTPKAQEWVESTLTRLFENQKGAVIAGFMCMKPASAEAEKQITSMIQYLTNHRKRLDYRAGKLGGYHIGSGAIESANKFIAHVRLKRSGAWWYPSKANNILKLRCAKANGTFDRITKVYRDRQLLHVVARRKPDDAEPGK